MAQSEGPQHVTVHGCGTVVVLSEESIHASCGARSGQHKPLFQVLDGHASDERPGTAAKSSGLKVIKVARCTRA